MNRKPSLVTADEDAPATSEDTSLLPEGDVRGRALRDVVQDYSDTAAGVDTSPDSASIRGSVRSSVYESPSTKLSTNGDSPVKEYDDTHPHNGHESNSNQLDAPLLAKNDAAHPLARAATAAEVALEGGSVGSEAQRRAPKFRLYARMTFQGHKKTTKPISFRGRGINVEDSPQFSLSFPVHKKLGEHPTLDIEFYDRRFRFLDERVVGKTSVDVRRLVTPSGAPYTGGIKIGCELQRDGCASAGRAMLLMELSSTDNETTLHVRVLELEHLKRVYEDLNVSSQTKVLFYAGLAILLYLVVGTVFYALSEDWTFVQSLYFSIVTLTTVGYGDFSPHTTRGKLFSCIFVLAGISMIGSALGIVGSYLLEKQEKAILSAMKGVADNENGTADDDADESASRRSIIRVLAVSVGFFVVFVLLGIVYFVATVPDMSFVDATYLSVVSLTTVGYGDYGPTNEGARVFTMFWILIGTLVTAKAIGDCLEAYFATQRQQITRRIIENSLQTLDDVVEFDADQDGEVDKFEFLTRMLVKTNACPQESIDSIMKRFNQLDGNADGVVTCEEISHSIASTPRMK